MVETELVSVASLIEDLDYYPRCKIDSTHVKYIADAIAAGCRIPPVVADRKTRAIVDGVHRCRSQTRIYGPEATINVEWRDYANKQAMLLDAIALNATHGKALSSYDRVHCRILADQYGIPVVKLTAVLHMTIKTVRKQKARIMISKSTGERIPVKATFAPVIIRREMTELTDRQVEVNDRSGGMNQLHYVHQLLDMIRADLVDEGNGPLIKALIELHEELGRFLRKKKATG